MAEDLFPEYPRYSSDDLLDTTWLAGVLDRPELEPKEDPAQRKAPSGSVPPMMAAPRDPTAAADGRGRFMAAKVGARTVSGGDHGNRKGVSRDLNLTAEEKQRVREYFGDQPGGAPVSFRQVPEGQAQAILNYLYDTLPDSAQKGWESGQAQDGASSVPGISQYQVGAGSQGNGGGAVAYAPDGRPTMPDRSMSQFQPDTSFLPPGYSVLDFQQKDSPMMRYGDSIFPAPKLPLQIWDAEGNDVSKSRPDLVDAYKRAEADAKKAYQEWPGRADYEKGEDERTTRYLMDDFKKRNPTASDFDNPWRPPGNADRLGKDEWLPYLDYSQQQDQPAPLPQPTAQSISGPMPQEREKATISQPNYALMSPAVAERGAPPAAQPEWGGANPGPKPNQGLAPFIGAGMAAIGNALKAPSSADPKPRLDDDPFPVRTPSPPAAPAPNATAASSVPPPMVAKPQSPMPYDYKSPALQQAPRPSTPAPSQAQPATPAPSPSVPPPTQYGGKINGMPTNQALAGQEAKNKSLGALPAWHSQSVTAPYRGPRSFTDSTPPPTRIQDRLNAGLTQQEAVNETRAEEQKRDAYLQKRPDVARDWGRIQAGRDKMIASHEASRQQPQPNVGWRPF